MILAPPAPAGLPSRRTRRVGATGRGRRGVTLTEMLVVLVVMLVLIGVLAPSMVSFMLLDQHRAAKELALLYEQLHDEAVMRNVTFRIEYDLARGSYQVQVGEPGVLIFDNPRAREEWEEEQGRLERGMTEDELAAHQQRRQGFAKLEARFETAFELPSGSIFAGVYTPQYGEMVLRRDVDQERDDNPRVYSYIFPNGRAEHTMIWIASESDPRSGYAIEVEPLSGAVRLHSELVDWRESFDFVPSLPPDLPGA